MMHDRKNATSVLDVTASAHEIFQWMDAIIFLHFSWQTSTFEDRTPNVNVTKLTATLLVLLQQIQIRFCGPLIPNNFMIETLAGPGRSILCIINE